MRFCGTSSALEFKRNYCLLFFMKTALIMTLSIFGLIITSYIIYAHARNKKVICPSFSKECNAVLDSKWSRVLGVKNEIMGFIYYLIVFVFIGLSISSFRAVLVINALVIIAVLYSLFLTYIQSKKLGHFCFYCICTAIINLLLFFIIIVFN